MSFRLMCVVAHPDDECYGFGGALALAAEQGIETYVVCLTDGQAATHRGNAVSGAELGRMRREEFAASCKVLGVGRYELLDYQDGQLELVEFAKAAGKLVERMRQFQPDVVLTFGGEGGLNSHADHMIVSSLTTAAFHWAGREKRYPEKGAAFRPQRLFHLTTSFFLPDRPAPMATPWSLELDIRTVLDRKIEAFRKHLSQAPLMERTKSIFEHHGNTEHYALIATAEPQPVRVSKSLFEGLVDLPER